MNTRNEMYEVFEVNARILRIRQGINTLEYLWRKKLVRNN